ncbi:signal recognition particle-docking protein FtsY [Pelagibacterium xiamenense]|uniref:signal recognition particle-docking protein FtsY n=1 Tax=Pelagibacterium xiamenense TaxID=2901140 RepID=UPI001E441E53|nr:signal recognition particle-docking protein FtsY [Pelagibacterium xiamenense]MCD7058387.1 signal recognition particle-docking protein FtsY [Pelagibacterium xiamenense]
MSEPKKSIWDKLFGVPPEKSRQDENEAPEAGHAEAEEAPAPESEADPRDAAPPEMQAEWVKAGHPNPPEQEPPVPGDIWNPLDKPDAIEDRLPEDPEAPADEPEAETTTEAEAEPIPVTPDATPAPAEPEKKSWFRRLSDGLKRSSDNLTNSIGAIFTKRKLDDATLQDLEDTLIAADLGIDTAMAITETLRAEKFDKDVAPEEVRAALASEVQSVLAPVATPLEIDTAKKPFVILMVGVNGSGKTTTIGKLTAKYKAEGKSVLLAAGDTFRAAAVEQLEVWGQRNNVEVVTRPTGADASGLAFDAVKKAQDEGTDIVIIDTAGRLQNRTELMDELEKVIRVIKKRDETAPHATLLTLDATTGQNALNQVEIFGQKAGVTGLVMTKLDGTARGGILVAIARKFGLPIHFIGVGEAIGDLEPFKADDFARAISGLAEQ